MASSQSPSAGGMQDSLGGAVSDRDDLSEGFSSPERLSFERDVPHSTPRRPLDGRQRVVLPSPSTDSEDDRLRRQTPARTRLRRIALPQASSTAPSPAYDSSPARRPPSHRAPLDSPSSGTLVDHLDSYPSPSQTASTKLANAVKLATTNLRLSSAASGAGTTNDDGRSARSSPPLQERMSRSRFAPTWSTASDPSLSSSARPFPSDGPLHGGRGQAEARVRDIFRYAKEESERVAATRASGSSVLPTTTTTPGDGEDRRKTGVSDTAGLTRDDPLNAIIRDRARFQRALGLSTGDRQQPALQQQVGRSPAVVRTRDRIVTAPRAGDVVQHPSESSDSAESDDPAEELAIQQPSFLATPHPPGHMSFRSEALSARSPPRSDRFGARTGAIDAPREPDESSGEFINAPSVQTTPFKAPGTRRWNLQPLRLEEPLTPLPRDERPIVPESPETSARSRRLDALRAETKQQALQLAEAKRAFDSEIARTAAAIAADVSSETTATPSTPIEVRSSRQRGWWSASLTILLLLWFWQWARLVAGAAYRSSYLDGMVPAPLYPALDLIGAPVTAETLRAFGIDVPTFHRSIYAPLTGHLLRLIDMPPSDFRVPT